MSTPETTFSRCLVKGAPPRTYQRGRTRKSCGPKTPGPPAVRAESTFVNDHVEGIVVGDTANPTGDLRLTNLDAYFNPPRVAMPVISIVKKEIKASASVRLRSAAGARKYGRNSVP